MVNDKCRCKICKRSRKHSAILATVEKDRHKRFLENIYDLLLCCELDLDHMEAMKKTGNT